MSKIPLLFIMCILAVFIAFSGCTQSEADVQIPVTVSGDASDRLILKDACTPFECGNESEYNDLLAGALEGVAANKTGIADYSNQSWSSAFLSLNTLLDERYAFKEWRSVDFDRLYSIYAPAFADAEEKQDKPAYYWALREYLYAIPDGHVDVIPISGEFGARSADIAGSYGIGIIQTDSGKVIVSYVAEGSEAEAAGIAFGDEILTWNGEEIHDAVNETSYIWAGKKPSTAEGVNLHQQRLLTRAPVGETATITLADPSGPDSQMVSLTAFDDSYEGLRKTSLFLGTEVNDYGVNQSWSEILPQISNSNAAYRILPGGYAYIAVYQESFDVYGQFKDAMISAAGNNTPGIVLDFRFNNGGDDNLAACFAGWFVEEPVFYEYTTTYDPGTGEFPVVSEAWSSPQPDGYGGPVAVLVSPDTISSGEGLPMVFKNTGRGKIISWYGTNGAFGMNNLQAIMPLDMYIMFPDGASLDEEGIIQVDSNAELIGGVSPDIRVPLNEDTVKRAVNGEDVQLTYALQWLEEQQ
ncbi:S41 family peptidase [Methanoplanus endosymbiosus]|uniref:S41 family peptidase n=1 Tax=Methanoplanus endosymbiosus TaxID=33865 RepID=A0A9E7PL80_9EURY|nr:S41 family peptidase [Methanoplanus endosymbiosus]UUX91382.1 S41 family peptidase [Methanoplanus endosymbiosus]